MYSTGRLNVRSVQSKVDTKVRSRTCDFVIFRCQTGGYQNAVSRPSYLSVWQKGGVYPVIDSGPHFVTGGETSRLVEMNGLFVLDVDPGGSTEPNVSTTIWHTRL